MTTRLPGIWLVLLAILAAVGTAAAQPPAAPPPPRTPLAQETLSLLANEISGQMAFDNEVLLAGAPRLREPGEFDGTMFEAQRIFDLVRGYGIEHTRIERYPSSRTFDYPVEGELWVTEPERRLVARLGADAALVASGSSTSEVAGELIYVPPIGPDEAKKMAAAGPQERYQGKVALMWTHAREEVAKALDAAGVRAVISFSSRDRYLDPNQVVYGGGSYKNPNLSLGLSVSWRQWSELLEEVLSGRKVVVRARAKIETRQDKFEAVYSWIPGTEPDAKGVVFTAHLFEGYVKRGANDNMSGCVVQLEILRALNRLIAAGRLPRPRRTIYFLWPNEISGTYEFLRQHPGIADRFSVNVNMDMVGEWLRKNNAVMTMSECPDYLPSYLDGLVSSVMNYVWRTNDIVYLPDAPRGRPGGQYFPLPLTEKNGSDDAFRFFIHRATGGSDHICFNNPSVGVPGIELFTWPDQWYHADSDTPDKSDPTQMRRIAFVGAAVAWAAANCTDQVLGGLLDAVSDFGYRRVAERDLPRALRMLDAASMDDLTAAASRATTTVNFAVTREVGALRTLEEVYSGSPDARAAVLERVGQWEGYLAGLRQQVEASVTVRMARLGKPPMARAARRVDRRPASDPTAAAAGRIPALLPSIKGKEFTLNTFEPFASYVKAHPDAVKAVQATPGLANAILNWVNGRRTIGAIRDAVSAETGQEIPLATVVGYLEVLRTVRWLDF
jgi:aminopeptidase YwaD